MTHKYKFERIGLLYVLALSGIAAAIILSQMLIQNFVSKQENDSRVINLAGRQRMLSQKISKLALQINGTDNQNLRLRKTEELDSALNLWIKSHEGLSHGDAELGITGERSEQIAGMYEKIEPYYHSIVTNGNSLLDLLKENATVPAALLQPYINNILVNEGKFLDGMDRIVFLYDDEAKAKVIQVKNFEVILLLISLAIIAFELLFIFRPIAIKISQTIKDLITSEDIAKNMASEINMLYRSLEQSYQELADVDVETDLATLYAKTDVEGNFVYLSDKFLEVTEFEIEQLPSNLFQWLEQEGYKAEYLQDIQHVLEKGNSWNGEIKLTTSDGDFLWLSMNIVPLINQDSSTENFMVICTDVTEKKEAEARSQEINREKIESKVKEQRFRSNLILEGQEEERKRISRDIHDGIGQLLTALKFKLEAAELSQNETSRQKLIRETREILQRVIREVRRVSFNLTPSALSDYGIVATIKKFCAEVSRLSDKKVIFENRTGFINRLEQNIETNLYRIIQEAVNNAMKYSEAEEIKVILTHNPAYLNLEISDNGKGFDYDELIHNGHFAASGHGIFNMKERTSFINGNFAVESEIGHGTKINISLPLN